MPAPGSAAARVAADPAGGAAEALPPPSGEGTVVLDIGGDIGAAIVYFEAAHEHDEIEIRPAGSAWAGAHTAVRPRHLGATVRYAAVYATLHDGDYELRPCGGDPAPALSLTVRGGRVTEADWPR